MELKQVFFTRLAASVLWTIVLQVFPVFLYLLLTNRDIVHPIIWTKETALKILTVRNWIYLSPIYGVILLLGFVKFKEYMSPPVYSASRYQAFVNTFNRNNLLKGVIYLLLGFTLPFLYLGLNDNAVTVKCEEYPKHYCLNESSVFVIACGIWTAFYYFIRFDILAEKYLEFPIIQQLKFLQIRSQIFDLIKQSLKLSAVLVFYFIPLYYWYAGKTHYVFQIFLNTHNSNATVSFKGGIILEAWLISTGFFMAVMTLQTMMNIHFTEHYSFQLIKQPNSELELLSTALGETSKPLVQYLAYYDLYVISSNQNSIRWQIFTLSQPGGHPHTWNGILQECLKLMSTFIGEIEDIYKIPEPKRSPPPIPRHVHIHEFELSPRGTEILNGPGPLSPNCKLRSLVDPQPRIRVTESKTRFDLLKEKINGHINELFKNSFISYVFGEIPDAKIRFLVSNSQPIVWATQSVAELSAKALTEDKFGIVLKDLPIIISTLLKLKGSLEKLGNIQRKFQKLEHDICMKAALKSAVKRSLYKISIVYSDYLTDLPLSIEDYRNMQQFVQFKEC